MNHLKIGAAVAVLTASAAAQAAGNYCGELANPFGPYDYTDARDRQHLPIVERAHFTPQVERLIKGRSASVAGDISYTLRAFPNHHRALVSIGRLAIRENGRHPRGAAYSADCFFDRAIRFRPNDAMVRMIYGDYLSRQGDLEGAIRQLEVAVGLDTDNANINYTAGLLHLKNEDYEKARQYARKAYAAGYPLPGLKQKLVEAGKWE